MDERPIAVGLAMCCTERKLNYQHSAARLNSLMNLKRLSYPLTTFTLIMVVFTQDCDKK